VCTIVTPIQERTDAPNCLDSTDKHCRFHRVHSLCLAQQSCSDQDRLIVDVSRSHSDTPHLVGLLWTRDWSIAMASNNTQSSQETDIQDLLRDSNPQSQRATGCRLTSQTSSLLFLNSVMAGTLVTDMRCCYTASRKSNWKTNDMHTTFQRQ